MDHNLPHNDPDLELARAINRAKRSGDTSFAQLEDPLISPLIEHREQLQKLQRNDNNGKQEVWQQIAEATTSRKTPVHQIFTAKSFRWAAAAAVLIGVLTALIYLQLSPQTELIAQSGTSIKTVQLSDGSTVILRPHSQLSIVNQSPAALLYELEGEAFFKIVPQQHSFSVQTENGRVSVLGTQFDLSSWGDRMQVFLKEGLLKVQSMQGDSALVIYPGEAVTIGDKTGITYISNASGHEFTDWLNRQLIFENEPASQVANELEQAFDVSISLSAKVANKRLSGQLSLESLQVSLKDLGLVLGGTFVHIGERNYKFEVK